MWVGLCLNLMILGVYVICGGEAELAEVFSRLYIVSTAVTQMEASLKDRDQHDNTGSGDIAGCHHARNTSD